MEFYVLPKASTTAFRHERLATLPESSRRVS